MSVITEEQKLAIYFKDAGFIRWLMDMKYSGYNSNNIGMYYSRYEFVSMCAQRRCHDCAGSIPKWDTEAELQQGLIRREKCGIKQEIIHDRLATGYKNRFVLPKVFEGFPQLKKLSQDQRLELNRYVEGYSLNEPLGLYIYAHNRGAGRTACLWWIANEYVKANRIVKDICIRSAQMLMMEFQKEGFDRPEVENAKSCDVLMLDDFGNEKSSAWCRATLESILDHRITNNKITIVSSVIPFDENVWKHSKSDGIFSKIFRSSSLFIMDAPIKIVTSDAEDTEPK